MKTAMKKLLSFVLVAVLLVSAVPFQASAAGTTGYCVEAAVYLDGNRVGKIEWDEKTSVAVGDILAAAYAGYDSTTMELDKWEVSTASHPDMTVISGGSYTITEACAIDLYLKTKADPNACAGCGEVNGHKTDCSKYVDPTPYVNPTTTTYTVKVGIFNSSEDRILATVGPIDLTYDEYKALGNDVASAQKLLGTNKYAADAKEGNIYSVFKTGNDIIVYLKTVTVDGSSTENPPIGGNTEKVKLTVDTGSGSYYLDAYVGQRYVDVLKGKEPARPGQTFLGWRSASKNTTIVESTIIEGADTVTAMWSDAIKYTITFIDQRGTEPTVTYGKAVAYGSALGDLHSPSSRKGYVFMGWKINGKKVDAKTVYEWQGNVTAYADWALESDTPGVPVGGGTTTTKGKVYLEIYTNGDTRELVKRVNITDYADDNKITRKEVEKVVKKYLAAKSGYSLKMIGLFDEESWWWYTRDEETNGEDTIVVNRDGDDYVYVMVKNVKTAKKDETNPKTGDPMVTTMTIMTVSATTLALVYFFNKKRMFVK